MRALDWRKGPAGLELGLIGSGSGWVRCGGRLPSLEEDESRSGRRGGSCSFDDCLPLVGGIGRCWLIGGRVAFGFDVASVAGDHGSRRKASEEGTFGWEDEEERLFEDEVEARERF
jgi:hypothetical protein